MNPGIIAAFAYGILALIGGIIGYLQARSKPSLISGAISGALLIFSGIMQLQGQSWGLILAAVVTALLVVVFIVRLQKTKKFMPAGLMTACGVAALIVILGQLF